MEMSQLRAILALKELASFAKAGEHLHRSPPAVFGQIRQLEEEIGQRLYERVGKRLELTDAGRMLADYACTILEAHDEAISTLTGNTGGAGVIRIGCGPHSSLRILPQLLRAFLKKNPSVEVRLVTGDDPPLLKDLQAGSLDAVFMSLPVDNPELGQEALWEYEMVLVTPPARLRGGGKRPDLAELESMPFILYRRQILIDGAIRSLCAEIGLKPNIVMENDEPDSIKALVKLGIGITVLPLWSVADEVRRGALQILRPKTRQLCQYGILYRKSGYRPRVLASLIAVAREWPQWWTMARHVMPLPSDGDSDSA